MAKKIIRLSEYFNLAPNILDEKGIFNSFIGVDSLFFIDPFLFEKIDIKEFKSSRNKIKNYYRRIIRLLKFSKYKGDIAWRTAKKMMQFKEISAASLGYGQSTNNGNAIGQVLAERLINTAAEIISLGIEDPEIFELIGLFENDYGPDRLSDMTIYILLEDFLKFSDRLTSELKIGEIKEIKFKDIKYKLPRDNNGKAIILLPLQALRPLPTAQSWSDIADAAQYNEKIRKQYNQLVSEIWSDGSRRKIKKDNIKQVLLKNKTYLDSIIKAYLHCDPKGYNFIEDPKGLIRWFDFAQKFTSSESLNTKPPATPEELKEFVIKIINQFKRGIELNGLNKFLFQGNKPLHEKFTQLLFYAIADIYCNIYDVDLSREPNAGSGALDFKLSKGYKNKICVEIKLSCGKIVQGYTKQLPIYQESENVNESIYIIIRVTDSEKQISEVRKIYEQSKKEGKRMPEIFIIDARLFPPASKRH
jgi:hypothetical protein